MLEDEPEQEATAPEVDQQAAENSTREREILSRSGSKS